MPCWTSQPWPHNFTQTASGKPGAVQSEETGPPEFFAWINRNRRLAKDVEASIESVEAFHYAAFSVVLLRKLAR